LKVTESHGKFLGEKNGNPATSFLPPPCGILGNIHYIHHNSWITIVFHLLPCDSHGLKKTENFVRAYVSRKYQLHIVFNLFLLHCRFGHF